MTSVSEQRIASWSHVRPSITQVLHGADGWRQGLEMDRRPIAPRGGGRSFGDAAYSGPGGITCTAAPARAIQLDPEAALLQVDAAETVGAVHDALETSRFEFPIFGGTQWATVGGAVAGDIHGKNHFSEGSFGAHVAALTMLTADGSRVTCLPQQNADLFGATVGGMGLTGLIESVQLRLRPRVSRTLRTERALLTGLNDLRAWLAAEPAEFQFASWFDMTVPAAPGLFFKADRIDGPCRAPRRPLKLRLPRLPLIGTGTFRLAGALAGIYARKASVSTMHIRDFNYAGVHERVFGWNQLFAAGGMIEYQFVADSDVFPDVLDSLVATARRNRVPMLSAVVKRFGDMPAAGLLSFARPGVTMNFQTPWTKRALDLLSDFTDDLATAGGRINLTKDSCVTGEQFARMYSGLEAWRTIVRQYDPANRIRSAMAMRLQLKPW